MLRRVLFFLFLVAAGGFSVWACTADTFTSGDGGGSDGGGGDSGRNDSGDATVPDAANDAGGCVGPDYCKTTSATFCSDFDLIGTSVSTGWNTVLLDGGYQMYLVGDRYESCPKSLDILVPTPTTDSGSNPGNAFVTKSFPLVNMVDGGISSHWTLDFDLFPSQATQGQSFVLAHLREPALVPPGDSFGLAYANGAYQLQGGPDLASLNIQHGQWSHITLDVQYAVTAGTYDVKLYVNGGSSPQAEFKVSAGAPGSSIELDVGVGTPSNAPPGPIFYDNVVLRLLP